jgi:hypothetical protein
MGRGRIGGDFATGKPDNPLRFETSRYAPGRPPPNLETGALNRLGADQHLVSGRVCVASRRTRLLASHPLKHFRWGDSWVRLDEPELRHGRADDLGDMRRDEMGVVPLGHVRRGVAEVRRDRAPRPPIGAWHRCGSSPAASERSKSLDLGGPEHLPSRRSHRISHRIPRYAVGHSGMNGRHNGHEMSDFTNGATQKRTGRDERQRITKPVP